MLTVLLTAALVSGPAVLEHEDTPLAEPRLQGPAHVELPTAPAVENGFNVTFAYLGEMITHPGAVLGVEAEVATWRIYRVGLSFSIGGYAHPKNHGALFLLPEIVQRWVSPTGIYGEVLAGMGFLHRWPDGEVWERRENGAVEPTFRGGRPYLMLSTGVGVGWQLGPVSPFVRAQLFGIFPYNRVLVPQPALQLGVLYAL